MAKFARGNKAAKNRKHRRGGRPTKREVEFRGAVEKECLKFLQKHAKKIMENYVRYASTKGSPATVRHAVDKLIPPVQKVTHTGNVIFETNVPDDPD